MGQPELEPQIVRDKPIVEIGNYLYLRHEDFLNDRMMLQGVRQFLMLDMIRKHIGNTKWFGSYNGDRADIFVAPEGHSLDSVAYNGLKSVTRRFEGAEVVEQVNEGRDAKWSVTVIPSASSAWLVASFDQIQVGRNEGPITIFQDATSNEVGINSLIGHTNVYDFHQNQSRTLGLCESYLSNIFTSNEIPRAFPEDPSRRFKIKPLAAE